MELDASLVVEEGEGVYPPSEDTHLLLEAVDARPAEAFLEVGAGTGLVALHAARTCGVVATDVNPEAVRLCRRNARRNGVPLAVVRTDLFGGLRGQFDVIAFNPPYLPGEATDGWLERAWSGGTDGNRVILRFLEEARVHLAQEGRIYLLVSSHNAAALRKARELYALRPLRRKPLFFEEIAVYELRHLPGPSHKL